MFSKLQTFEQNKMTASISATKFWGSWFCGKRSLEHAGYTECEGGRGTDGAINKNEAANARERERLT